MTVTPFDLRATVRPNFCLSDENIALFSKFKFTVNLQVQKMVETFFGPHTSIFRILN